MMPPRIAEDRLPTPSSALALPEALWADGEMVLRVWSPGQTAPGPALWVGRPFALIGRSDGCDVRIADSAAGSRHVYLHLDARGLFGVDLATRSGTQLDGGRTSAGWLRPGGWVEVAGHRIEVVGLRVDGHEPAGPPPAAGMLGEVDSSALPRVSLRPHGGPSAPWSVNSELIFLGRSASCGVQISSPTAARIHCAVVRTPVGAFVVDVAGHGVQVDGRAVRGAAALANGRSLAFGGVDFEVRIEPPAGPAQPLATRPAEAAPPSLTELLPEGVPMPPLPAGLATDLASQQALLAWMMGAMQATQAEMLRRQDAFQGELVRALGVLHRDNQAALKQHAKHVVRLQRELSSLRDDVRERFSAAPPPPAEAPAMPKPPPLRVPTAAAPPTDPANATAWLLNRVNQIDRESKSSWRDLLGRINNANANANGTPPAES